MSKRGKSIKIEKPCPYVKMMRPLIGGIISNIIVDKASVEGEVYCGLIIKNGSRTFELVALSDDEGNSPGSFCIEEHK